MKKPLLILFATTLWLQHLSSQIILIKTGIINTDSLEKVYQQELEAMPNSPIPHWNQAKALSHTTQKAYDSAWEYFEKALAIDSSNADIYIDYGNYLLDNRQFESALICLDRAVKLRPGDQGLQQQKKNLAQFVIKEREYISYRTFPRTIRNHQRKVVSYKQMTDFTALLAETLDKKSNYHYPKLLEKFVQNPDYLSDYETYMLLLGHTRQKKYSPYLFSDERELQLLAHDGKLEKALTMGHKLLKKDPLSLAILFELLYCHRRLQHEEQVKDIEKRISSICDAILSSGNGTCEQPFIAIRVPDEYLFVEYIGLTSTNIIDQLNCNDQTADRMVAIRKSDGGEEFVFFNVELMLH